MRLTKPQIKQINEETRRLFGENALVRLFGSRLDDEIKGGDVDLLIEVKENVEHPASLPAKLSARLMVANHGLKFDIILLSPNLPKQSIHEVAMEKGVIL